MTREQANKLLCDARHRNDAEWTFFWGMDKPARDGFDTLLVQAQHPIAYEPGTQEHRFTTIAQSKWVF